MNNAIMASDRVTE